MKKVDDNTCSGALKPGGEGKVSFGKSSEAYSFLT